MKTFISLILITVLVFSISGCGALAVKLDNETGGNVQKWVYGTTQVQQNDAPQMGPKEIFLAQCLMDQTRDPNWCLRRAAAAFPQKTALKK